MLTFSQLAHFYHNLAALDQAGLTYLKTFEGFKRTETNLDKLSQIQFMISHLSKNRTLSEGLRFSKYVPVFDIPLIKAAEDSGRLVEVFKSLSAKYNEAAISEKEIRGRMIHPAFTFIVALFVPSFPDLFLQKISLAHYLRNSLGVLIVLGVLLYLFYQTWLRSFYEQGVAQKIYHIFSYIPFVKGLNQKIALEKFSSGLAMMLDSGMDLFESLKQASLCSGDPQLKAAVDQFIPMIRRGVDIGKVFQSNSHFPADLVNAISMGADSGKMPEFIRRYGDQLKEEINTALKILTKFIPMVVYFLVTIYVVSIVLRIYAGHLNEVMDVLKDT